MREALTFDDVLMVPNYSEILSRKEIDISSNFSSKMPCTLPVISSPMDTVTEDEMAIAMAKYGGASIIHRYNTIGEQVELFSNAYLGVPQFHCRPGEPGGTMDGWTKPAIGVIGAAIGITGDYLERAQELVNARVKILCLDVAHGHHILMKRALAELHKAGIRDSGVHLMAGNVATGEGFLDLADWGADSVRIGIGGGSICSTRIQTGHGVSNFSAIRECYGVAQEMKDPPKLIIDGGIRSGADIVKSLAAGADFVMCGSMLAGTKETPGDVIDTPKGFRKTYRGMASKEAQVSWRGRISSLEGIATTVPYKGSVADVLQELERNIRSGFSYSGASNLIDLRQRARFIKQSAASQYESFTHITQI